jgi:hypothetical protein
MMLLKAQWDRVAAISAAALGLLSLLIGWIGVSGTEFVAEQMSFVASGGLFGVFALGVAAALWISADLRDEWRKLDSVEELLAEALERLDAGVESVEVPSSVAAHAKPAVVTASSESSTRRVLARKPASGQ